MGQLIILFSKNWIDEQRKNGRNVVRLLEKWIASIEGITLQTSAYNKLVIELELPARENFLKAFAERMTADFGESNPWEHIIFSGDVDGLDVPTSSQQPSKPLDQKSEPPMEKKWQTEKKQDSEVEQPQGSPQSQQNLQTVVDEICSQVPIKHSPELETYIRETAEIIPMLKKLGNISALWHQHLLVAVDAGYGRSEFLKCLVHLYKAFGLIKGEIDAKTVREFILLPKGQENEADGYRVSWDAVISAAKEMDQNNTRNKTSKVVLYVDISEWQSQLTKTECKLRLRRLNALCGTFLIVFRVPFIDGYVLRQTADALNDILNVRTLSVPPAPVEAMIDYACSKLSKSGFEFDPKSVDKFEQMVLREKVDNSFFGYKTMDKIVQNMIYKKALANCRRNEEGRVITLNEFDNSVTCDTDNTAALDMKSLIGMESIQQRLEELIVQIQTQKKMAAAGKNVGSPCIHMLFTGNPGTGKTTVARILARMMHQAGILPKGHFVEVRGRDLCGRYVGETAPKTTAICRDAYGSVLFIDEAYSLFRNDQHSGDYGREALDTLVAEMENHRDDLCVIMAGYKDEMQTMLSSNAGLQSRIPFEIEFPNYTRNDLEKIFFSMLDGVFDYEEGMQEVVHEFFANIPQEVFDAKDFSNARLVRNLFERTWGKAAYRQKLEGGELRILKSDLAGATSDNEFKNLLKKTAERSVIGFNA